MSYVGNVASGGELNLVASTLYGECASLASTAAKVVTIANYDALLIGTTNPCKVPLHQYSRQPDTERQ